jgi:flagellar secretion chaperone FliS
MYGTGYQTYQQTNIITADPKRLVMMCYEGAIHFLERAKEEYLNREYEAKGKAIQNVLGILNELREALDFEKGGEIARNLDHLYSFMIRYILRADRERDLKVFDQVAVMLKELKSAWEEVFRSQPLAKNVLVSREEQGLYPFESADSLRLR